MSRGMQEQETNRDAAQEPRREWETSDSSPKFQERTRPEWITFGVSLVIVLVFLGTLVTQALLTGREPARILLKPQLAEVSVVEGQYYLPVQIQNEGDQAASDVWIGIVLEYTDDTEAPRRDTALVHIDFLPGHGSDDGIAVFESDPRRGEVSTGGIGYLKP